MPKSNEVALVIGAGPGLSAAIARTFSHAGLQIALASRGPEKVADLAKETGARAYRCDVSSPEDMARLFTDVEEELGVPDLVVFNPNFQMHGQVQDIDPADMLKAFSIVPFGAFLAAREAASRMIKRGRGTLLFTGNPSSIQGRPKSPMVAMTKGALRGLVESLARELQPQNIHVATVIADASIDKGNPDDPRAKGPDSLLDPDAIAEAFLFLYQQKRTGWSSELQVRTWVSPF